MDPRDCVGMLHRGQVRKIITVVMPCNARAATDDGALKSAETRAVTIFVKNLDDAFTAQRHAGHLCIDELQPVRRELLDTAHITLEHDGFQPCASRSIWLCAQHRVAVLRAGLKLALFQQSNSGKRHAGRHRVEG